MDIDIETCPACVRAARIIASFERPEVIENILAHLDTKAAEHEAHELAAVPGIAPVRTVRLIRITRRPHSGLQLPRCV